MVQDIINTVIENPEGLYIAIGFGLLYLWMRT